MLKVIEMRKSIRKFSKDKVDQELILELIESARMAPSGSNTQPWNFIIVTEEGVKEQLVSVDHHQKWMLDAPVFLVCVADIRCRITDGRKLSLDIDSPEPELKQIIRDTAIAIGYLLLEAENQRLGACWTAWFGQQEVRRILNIPDDKFVCGIIPIGYAKENAKQPIRRSVDEMVYYERWQ